MRWAPFCLTLSGIIAAVLAPPAGAAELSLEQRVEAQRAIERVYHRHRIDDTRPFEQTVTEELLERKVRTYLAKSVALASFWNTPITADALQREMERISRDTRFPERLAEIYSALGHDPLLVLECVARPALVDRLARNFFAVDERIHGVAQAEIERIRERLTDGELDPRSAHPRRSRVEIEREELGPEAYSRWRARAPRSVGDVGPLRRNGEGFVVHALFEEHPGRFVQASYIVPRTTWEQWWAGNKDDFLDQPVSTPPGPLGDLPLPGRRQGDASVTLLGQDLDCVGDDVWDNGILDDGPGERMLHTAIWTGSEMIVWGGRNDAVPFNGLKTGARYDPLLDVWSGVSTELSSLHRRKEHTAVWTGSEMIVWGGRGSAAGRTGERYDPVSDSWTPVDWLAEMSGRWNHSAVWTGSEMIIWGGESSFGCPEDGWVYDPGTDGWTALPTTGAPPPRGKQTAVWNGDEMIVWGGRCWGDGAYDYEATGGRYDPGTGQWQPTPTNQAPTPRAGHAAVWTGDEMLVWGGYDGQTYLDSGGSFVPDGAGSWTALPTDGAPSGRSDFASVWSGSQMIVWGGFDGDYLDTGGRYHLATETWTPTQTLNAPRPRAHAPAVWSGNLMLVAGGETSDGIVDTGGRYDPLLDGWTPTEASKPAPEPRHYHSGVWTGNLLLVWGGQNVDDQALESGGRYDPLLDSWTPTTLVGAPEARRLHTAVWTGREMVVWGGLGAPLGAVVLGTGGRYDPVADAWQPTSAIGAPPPIWGHSAVWTGSLMLVWGGTGRFPYPGFTNTWRRYDPIADSWYPMAVAGAPDTRVNHVAVWTGDEMIVWGGDRGSLAFYMDEGGRYDPSADVWRPVSSSGAPSPRTRARGVWTGAEMVVWGGNDAGPSPGVNDGGRYDPVADAWTPTSTVDAPSGRTDHPMLWTGRDVLVWSRGGSVSGFITASGGRYDPAVDAWSPTSLDDAPPGRTYSAAIWSGRQMILWGGVSGSGPHGDGGRYALHQTADLDGDGVDVCDGDCDDLRSEVYPDAAELCDGLDNDCDGTVDEGHDPTPDADGDGWFVCNGDCDDSDPLIRPGVVEECDFTDNDCDGVEDNGFDQDDDGVVVCAGDCDDQDPTTFPDAVELRDCKDNDCDDIVDNDLINPQLDLDGDFYSPCGGDCDDDAQAINPGAEEVCDDIDNNCNGLVDEDRQGEETDGDLIHNACDNCPLTANPDQANADGDPGGDVCDCAPDDGSVWRVPDVFLEWTGVTTVFWGEQDPGALDTSYDLLASPDAADFDPGGATCLAADTSLTAFVAIVTPPSHGVFFYLVRGRNACGASLGLDSSGFERTGRECTGP